ncbi:MAG: glycosyltransferase [Zoogloeaceae bacterium]|nr:glycosyltransferase [Zoogloeaceae bacterium]
MKVSVIVPMYNEARHIVRTLESVRRAGEFAGVACELLVMDNGSGDDGPALAAGCGARVDVLPGLSLGALRNRGAQMASGEWLAFLDADIEVPRDWFALWREIDAQGETDVLALACKTPPSAPWFARVWQQRKHSPAPRLQPRDWLTTQNLCMRRDWFARVGGFNESLITGEDKDFTLRLHQAGVRLKLLAGSFVWHWGYEGSWREWLGKEFWRQGGALQLLDAHFASLRRWRFPLLCLGTAFCSLAAPPAALTGKPAWAGLLLLPGALIALGLALRQSLAYRAPLFTLQLWILHWLRLHVGAAALLAALCKLRIQRPERT